MMFFVTKCNILSRGLKKATQAVGGPVLFKTEQSKKHVQKNLYTVEFYSFGACKYQLV